MTSTPRQISSANSITPRFAMPGLALAIATLLAPGVMAQGTLEEVVVTAQKRSQSLQDVGISIAAFNRDDAKDQDLGNVDRLAAMVPNLQALDAAAGLPSFRIRGIGLNEFQAAFDSPVGVHMDEIFLSKPMMASMSFYDIERIEVLKGPQGTVFGRNTTGGAVNYYSVQPTEEFAAGILASYGNYDRLNSQAYISGPLSDTVRGRLSVDYLDHGDDGQYHNLYNNDDIGELKQEQIRGQLAWNNDQTSVLFASYYGSKNGDLVPYDNLFQEEPGGVPDVTKEIRNPISRTTLNQDYWPKTDSSQSGASFRIDHDLEIGTLTSLSGYKTFKRDNREDSDNTPIISTNIDWYSRINQFTQEFRLTGDRDRWHYLVGAYYENDDLETVETLAVTDLWELELTSFAQLGADHNVTTDSYALFTSHEYELTEKFSLIAGARYTKEKNKIKGQSFLTTTPIDPVGSEDVIPPEDRVVLVDADNNRSDNDTNFKLGLNYQHTDDVLVYLSASTGFRSGGYDLAFGSPSLETFEPEDVTSYELGAKSTLLDNTMTLNGALFYNEVQDYQSNVNLAGELVPRRRNIGTLETYGGEAEMNWQPDENWRFQLSGGYTHAEITDVAKDVDGNDFVIDGVPIKGNEPVNSPKWSFSALVNYVHPISPEMEMEFLTLANWNDERYLELENGDDHLVDSYYTVDASISLQSPDRAWRVSAWGKNLTDEDYLRYINDVPGFALFLTINAEPRTYGVSVEYNL